MRRGALDQQLRRGDQGGDVVAHHALVVGVVTLVQVTDGEVAANDAGAVPRQVVTVTLRGEGGEREVRGGKGEGE